MSAPTSWHPLREIEIAAPAWGKHLPGGRDRSVLGESEHAVLLLREAFGQGVRHSDALHRDVDFASLRSNSDFQELLRPKG
jgi:hypothetical protein